MSEQNLSDLHKEPYTGLWDHETQLRDKPKRTLRQFYESHRPSKMHLFQLPVCKDDLNWRGESKDLCIVIPVFNETSNPLSVQDYILQSAIWSYRCWLYNTNAYESDIPIYLYIEDTVIEENAPILLNNGVPGNAVRSFVNQGFDSNAKKINALIDPQFNEYDMVLVSDVDLFPLRGNVHDVLYNPVLSRILESPEHFAEKGIGVLCSEPMTTSLDKTSRAAYWFEGRKYPQSWQDTVKGICELPLAEVVIETFETGGVWIYPWTPLYLFSPAKLCMGRRNVLRELARQIPEDEFVISLFREMSGMELYPLDSHLDLYVIHDLMGDRFIGYCNADHQVPALLHASSSVDFFFQHLIGVHKKV